MTPSEFKAWFEGYTEGMMGPPTARQWERVKARVREIDGAATPYPVFLDKYVMPYREHWPLRPLEPTCGTVGVGAPVTTGFITTSGTLGTGKLGMGMNFWSAGLAEYRSGE